MNHRFSVLVFFKDLLSEECQTEKGGLGKQNGQKGLGNWWTPSEIGKTYCSCCKGDQLQLTNNTD